MLNVYYVNGPVSYEVSTKINATLSIVPLSEVMQRLKTAHLKGLNLINK